MAKLLTTREIAEEKTWFLEIHPTSFYSEEDLERAVILNLENLFPEFYALPFKKALTNTENGRKNKPDLALIKKDYTEWYIIEVELGHHSVSHVKEQVETFYNSLVEEEHADYMYNKRPDVLSLELVRQMVLTYGPKLMVILNEHSDDIKSAVEGFNCLMCVFQIFLDKNSNPIYRLNGQHPMVYTSFCHCRLTKNIPFSIEVLDRNFCENYGIALGGEALLSYNDKITKWTRNDAGERVFLICESRNFPIDPSTPRYMLSYNSNTQSFKLSKS